MTYEYKEEDFPISMLPDRSRILDNFDKAITHIAYAKKYKYSPHHVCKLCQNERLDCIKLMGRWFVLDLGK